MSGWPPLAGRQYGVVTRASVAAPAGVGETRDPRSGCGSKRLHRLHRGVYAVGHSRAALAKRHWMAAGPGACGPGAVPVARRAPRRTGRSGVATAARRSMSRCRLAADGGLRLGNPLSHRRSGRLGRRRRHRPRGHPRDERAPEPCSTSPTCCPTQALKRAIDEAEYRRLFDLTAVIAAVRSAIRGAAARRCSAAAQGPPEMTRACWRTRLLGRRRAPGGLPRAPRSASGSGATRSTSSGPPRKLIVESDGFDRSRHAQLASRPTGVRDRRLARAGLRTIQADGRARCLRGQEAIAADLASALSRSRASSKPPSRASTSSASAR